LRLLSIAKVKKKRPRQPQLNLSPTNYISHEQRNNCVADVKRLRSTCHTKRSRRRKYNVRWRNVFFLFLVYLWARGYRAIVLWEIGNWIKELWIINGTNKYDFFNDSVIYYAFEYTFFCNA